MEGSTTQQAPSRAEPQKEHRWLQKLEGDWSFESEGPAEPGQPAWKSTGTESVRSLDGIWIIGEGQGEMPDGSVGSNILTLGYDPERKRFVGTWVGSMMTHLWVYEGELDAAGRVLTLNTEGPRMSEEGGLAKYQETIEFRGDDERMFTSRMLGDDGQWHPVMTATYRRKK